jgi:hypothetical protein
MGLSTILAILALVSATRIAHFAISKVESKELRRINDMSSWSVEALTRLGGPIGDFVRSIESEVVPYARIDRFSERLALIDEQTWDVEKRIFLWAKVALFGGIATSIAYLCKRLGQGAPPEPIFLGAPFVIGASASIACRWVGRLAGRAAIERRKAWDTLSATLFRPLVSEQVGTRSTRIEGRGLTSRGQRDA